jgi:hypothetical protein
MDSQREAVNLVKVFSVTKARERDQLGERVTAWIQERPGTTILNTVVRLSSDSRFHCLSIVLLCHEAAALVSRAHVSDGHDAPRPLVHPRSS